MKLNSNLNLSLNIHYKLSRALKFLGHLIKFSILYLISCFLGETEIIRIELNIRTKIFNITQIELFCKKNTIFGKTQNC